MTTAPTILRQHIFDSVDALRQRKCRPDRESIAHYILRKHGIKFNEVFNELESIVDEELLVKVEYKGSISYRMPSQFDTRSSPLLTKHSKILNSVQTTRFIITAVNELLASNESYNVQGIPFNELKTKLTHNEPTRYDDQKASVVIERELFSKSGNLFKSGRGKLFPKGIPIPDEEDEHLVPEVVEKTSGTGTKSEDTEEILVNDSEKLEIKPKRKRKGSQKSEPEVLDVDTEVKPKIVTLKKQARRRGADITSPEKTEMNTNPLNPSEWTPDQVENYFLSRGMKEEGKILREQEIDGLSLLLMRRKDITQFPKLLLGPALKVHRVVLELQK